MSLDGDSGWQGFSVDPFLDALQCVYFPNARKAVVECNQIRVRTLLNGSREAISGFWQMPFYLEPITGADRGIPVPFVDAVVQATTAVDEPGPPGLTASPFIRWGEFGDWESFVRSRTTAQGIDSPTSVERKARRLAREVGPMEVRIGDDDPATLESIFLWKSAQYRRTGLPDRFAVGQVRELYHELLKRGLLEVSSVRAGGTLVAGSVSGRLGPRFSYRLPAYDPAFARHSPGAILLQELLKASFDAGDDEFDFLIGGEPYKFAYATHVRWVGPIGREPIAARIRSTVRARAGSLIQNRRVYAKYKRMTRR